MRHSTAALLEMTQHRDPTPGGAWDRERAAAAQTTPVERLYEQLEDTFALFSDEYRAYHHYDQRSKAERKAIDRELNTRHRQLLAFAQRGQITGDELVKFSRDLAEFGPTGMSNLQRRILREAVDPRDPISQDKVLDARSATVTRGSRASDTRSSRGSLVQIDPRAQERGVGESANKGRVDIARSLSWGGTRPDSAALAREYGLTRAQLEGRSPGVPPAPGAAQTYLVSMSDADLQKILPRQRAEGRARWLGRIWALMAAQQRGAAAREPAERSKNTALTDQGSLAYRGAAKVGSSIGAYDW